MQVVRGVDEMAQGFYQSKNDIVLPHPAIQFRFYGY